MHTYPEPVSPPAKQASNIVLAVKMAIAMLELYLLKKKKN